MPSFYHKFNNLLRKLFKKEIRYVSLENKTWILSLEKINDEKIECSLINLFTLIKYKKIILLDSNHFFFNQNVRIEIINALSGRGKTEVLISENEIKFNLFDNGNLTYNYNDEILKSQKRKKEIILEKDKIEHEDIYQIFNYYLFILENRIKDLENKSKFLNYQTPDNNQKNKNKINEIKKKVEELELEVKQMESFNRNFDYVNLTEYKKIETNQSITKMDILGKSQIIYTSDHIYLSKINKIKENTQVEVFENTFFYGLNVINENNFFTFTQNSIQMWECDKIESKSNKNKKFKSKIINIEKMLEKVSDKKTKTINNKIVEIICTKKNNLIVFLYSGEILLLEKKEEDFKIVFYLIHNSTLTGGIILEDKNILDSTGDSSEGTKFLDLKNCDSELIKQDFNIIIQIKEAKCSYQNAICKLDEDRIIIGGGKKKNNIKIISISSKDIIHLIDFKDICHSISVLKKKYILIGGRNIMIFNINNYDMIQSIKYEETINGFLELNNDLVLSYDIHGKITLWSYSEKIEF